MTDELFEYKDFKILVNSARIHIDKSNNLGGLHATIVYDRKNKFSTFSGQFPWVIRGGSIHKKFNEIITKIGTSTKVTKVKEPAIKAILDSIKK